MIGAASLKVIILTGPSGVGKSALAFEISAILQSSTIKHALIDTDELDRIYPAPKSPETLSERNLSAVWQNFAEFGCNRLILCGVMANLNSSLAWVKKTLPTNTHYQIFRLTASREEIRKRLTKREIGSLKERHLISSLEAVNEISKYKDGAILVDTDNKPIIDIAGEVLRVAMWL